MDKKQLEDKLKNIEIPLPDEDKKEKILQAALNEYDNFLEKKPDESKGSAEPSRLTDKRAKKSFFRGGSVMTRPVYATISVFVVGIFAAYSFIYVKDKNVVEPVRIAALMSKNIKVEDEKFTVTDQDAMVKSQIVDSIGKLSRDRASAKPAAKAISQQVQISTKEISPFAGGGGKVDKLSGVMVAGEVAEGKAIAGRTNEPVSSHSRRAKPQYEGLYADKKKAPMKLAMMKSKARESVEARLTYEMSNMVASSDIKSTMAPKEEAAAPLMSRHRVMPEVEQDVTTLGREYAGRDKFDRIKDNPVKVTREEPVSTFSIDVDTASYSFVRRALTNGYLPQKDAVRVEELINYFNYDYAAPKSRIKPFKPTVAVYPSPWNEDNKLVLIGIKGHELERKERPRANLVFLLDVSGSMNSRDKLPLLKNSMKMLVNELNPDDTVAIAVYAGAAGTVLEPTKISEKGKILAALERLQAGGSTAGGAGIKLAYALAESNFDKNATNRVILATDGDFNVGIRNSNELKGFVERKRDSGVFLSVLGFGQGNYNDELMQKLAQNGNGNAAYIDTLSEARKVLVDEAGATLFSIAKDVKIQIEFNPATVAEYRLIGYESRILNREDFNNDKVDAGDVGAGHSVTAIYEIMPANNEAPMIDPLRYGNIETKNNDFVSSKGDVSSEYAHLKIRYKLPDEDKSRLISTTIYASQEFGNINKLKNDFRFATSVAAFAQILKGGIYTGAFTYDDVIELAASSRGDDRFGYRSEFLALVRLAKSADTMGQR